MVREKGMQMLKNFGEKERERSKGLIWRPGRWYDNNGGMVILINTNS